MEFEVKEIKPEEVLFHKIKPGSIFHMEGLESPIFMKIEPRGVSDFNVVNIANGKLSITCPKRPVILVKYKLTIEQ